MSHNPYQSPYGSYNEPPRQQYPGKQKHSGIGLASFVISLICGVVIFLAIIMAGAAEASGGVDEGTIIVIGLTIWGAGFVALIGLVLGIVGALQPNCNKVFAVLGAVFNGLIMLGIFGLMVIGMAAGGV